MESDTIYMIDLLELEHDALKALLATWGEPSYRAEQVWGWLYTRLAAAPEEMSNLPKKLRTRLEAETRIGGLKTLARQASQDGETVKWLFQLLPAPDGGPLEDTETGAQTETKIEIETVLMRYRERRTACISSQAGCAMGCTFCATGQMGLQRDLSAGEIVAQVLFVARELARQEERLTNVVLMGMGEPLANYDATLAAINRLTDPNGFNMGQRRITLSTVGLVPGIGRLSREGLQINLAVSLHAATDALRDTLVPLNRRYPLDQLMAVCSEYFERTGRRVTFEWALIDGVNDSLEQARALAEKVRGRLACHVNLIPLNPTASYPGAPASPEQVAAFGAELSRQGISNTVRVRRGIDIQAGCGQLRERMGHSA
jgi:23S rRNA (adenine2503-C2)-methyltransferase